MYSGLWDLIPVQQIIHFLHVPCSTSTSMARPIFEGDLLIFGLHLLYVVMNMRGISTSSSSGTSSCSLGIIIDC